MSTITELNVSEDFRKGLELYVDHLCRSYYSFWPDGSGSNSRFHVEFEDGKKYIRVVNVTGTSRSAHTFIVKQTDNKFQKGDILKSSGWSAPAKNYARGNILSHDFLRIRWTGGC